MEHVAVSFVSAMQNLSSILVAQLTGEGRNQSVVHDSDLRFFFAYRRKAWVKVGTEGLEDGLGKDIQKLLQKQNG